MRLIIASVFAYMAVMPVFAVGLPVVNVGGNGVSARYAFGEEMPKTVNDVVTVEPVKRVVTRRPNQKVNIAHNPRKSDTDFLTPNLPSSNLWAENSVAPMADEPLRLPTTEEFAVLHNENMLPDETLDEPEFAINAPAPESKTINMDQVSRDLENKMNRLAEIDAQIARLSELQQRANNSVKVQRDIQKNIAANNAAEPVKIARTIVPMNEPDVLVRTVEQHKVAKPQVDDEFAGLSPTELRKAFRKTFLSENKHLSAMTDSYNDASDTIVSTGQVGFTTDNNLSDMNAGIRAFEIKVSFRNFDAALSRENYTLLTTFAGIVVNNPKRAIQILIPKDVTINSDNRKLTARRLAIVEQVLRDAGVPEDRIMPVLSNRDDDGALVLRNIDSTQYESLTKQKTNKFGKTSTKTYKSMSW